MKEQEEKQEARTLVINVNLTRGLVAVLIAALLVVAFVGYLALGQRRASASSAVPAAPQAPAVASSGLRKFYRTATAYTPTLATTACAPGYHFASIWELLDPSNLEYAGELGDAYGGPLYDMGEGPVTGAGGLPIPGYVRTGYSADVSDVKGQANCNNWTSDDSGDRGTMAGLTHEWGSVESLFVWNILINTCNVRAGVWCVED